MKKIILLSVILIVGCANYQYISYIGEEYGYRDGQFSDDTFWIEYLHQGNKNFNEKYTLLRSAEVTKENGFKYFVVLKEGYEILGGQINEFVLFGNRFIIQCYEEKPSNIDFNALDNYAVIYEADMVINNYQYLYNKKEAKKRRLEE